MNESTLLLELGVPFQRSGERLLVEAQALNGLRLWLDHFDKVTVCAVELPPGNEPESTMLWADPTELLSSKRLAFAPMPSGYHPRDHFKHRHSVTRQFRSMVRDHRYLCFSNLGAFGAWGNLGAAEAQRQGRPYALWFDWVVHRMGIGAEDHAIRKVKRIIYASIAKHATLKAIKGCTLGLFHGQTVYEAYAPLCAGPELVHDVHIHPEDAVSDVELATKIDQLQVIRQIKIGYVGRVHPMKAPLQWIEAIAQVVERLGPGSVRATWLGDGPLLAESRAKVSVLGLEDSIRFEGFVQDRDLILDFLRSQHIFAFCHVTPESPRCLIESLISGTPLIGYESSYAQELVGDRGGAILTAVGDVKALSKNLVGMVLDRQKLSRITSEAATARGIYSDEAVFEHRSNLIKQYL